MKTNTLLLTTLLLFSGVYMMPTLASGDHGHHDDHMEQAEEAKGPNNGKLLKQGDFTVELTIFEAGIPPEMRLYAYDHGQPVSPEKWQVEVTLDRLGGEQDRLKFTAENNYKVGDQVVREPHSYDVTVRASYQGQSMEWHYDNHEGRTTISERQRKLAGIKTAIAGPAALELTDTLFGVIAAPETSIYRVNAPYPGIVDAVYVEVGDQVKKGQKLLTLTNTVSLQQYTINSPAKGEVTQRLVNIGDRAGDSLLLEVMDLASVWVEMSAFPESIEKLSVGQPVTVRDLHHHESVSSTISYIAPQMTGGHIARARTVVDNSSGHWRPGMHIKAEVLVEQRQLPLAIQANALQSFRDMPVVYAKYGDTFEVRMLELGDSNGNIIEVLGGIKPGTEYATENSYTINADVLKSGASHDH